jgi:antitoxin component of RelBE/YafQ-DinJ toxin-antitoxin module
MPASHRTAVLSVKVPTEDKVAFVEAARELGQTPTSLVNGFVRQVIRDRTVTFSAAKVPSKTLQRHLAEAEDQIARGETTPLMNQSDVDSFIDSL